jgi:hypothetical protein
VNGRCFMRVVASDAALAVEAAATCSCSSVRKTASTRVERVRWASNIRALEPSGTSAARHRTSGATSSSTHTTSAASTTWSTVSAGHVEACLRGPVRWPPVCPAGGLEVVPVELHGGGGGGATVSGAPAIEMCLVRGKGAAGSGSCIRIELQEQCGRRRGAIAECRVE